MPTRLSKGITALDAVAADGSSVAIENKQFRHAHAIISTAASANATVKLKGSFQDTAPDFSSAASVTNKWDYVASYNLNDPSSVVVGDTGVLYAGTDAVEQLIINIDGMKWLAAEVDDYVAGNITVDIVCFDNT